MHLRACRALGLFMALIGCTVVPATAIAQQFIDSTNSQFPFPNPAEYTNQLTIGDIDNDGDLDIIFANGAGFTSAETPQVQRIFINNGSGTFTDQSVARLNFSGICRGVELGDIDNDGDLDLVFAQDFNRRPALFLNDGNGFFTNVTAARLPALNLSSSRVGMADIDNDGDLDLYFVSGGASRFGCGQSRVYINNGFGFFTDETASRHPIENFCEPMDCIFGDIDGDFDLDIRTAGRGTNNSKLLRNNGNGVFTLVAGVPADSTCYSYDFGDMNGDGHLDLLGANAGPNNTELLLLNDGLGGFTNVSSQLQTNPTVDDNDSKFFDYDNDGDLDIIIAALGGTSERIYTNDGNGIFSQAAGIITAVSDSSLDVKVGDLNNNGRLDIVTAQGESGNFANRIYTNFGPADTIPPRIVKLEQLSDTDDTTGPYVVRAAILDGMTSDRNFFDKGIFLNFSVNGHPPARVPMRYSGGQIYRGVIPGQPCGGTISYYVQAKDWAGNIAVGEPQQFYVTPPAPLRFDFNGGQPAPNLLPPCEPISFEVDIRDCADEFQPGTAVLHYQYGSASGSAPLIALSATLHRGELPAATCGTEASYYISAQTTIGQTVYFPSTAPGTPRNLSIGVLQLQDIYSEDFEDGLPPDWTATQLWHVSEACTVPSPCDGAAWAYCGIDATCNYDAGATDSRLTTAPITLPDSDQITLKYCSTFQREAFGTLDWPSVRVNGAVVDEPASGNLASSPWQQRVVNLTGFAGQAVTIEWRFDTIDAFGNEQLGWQVDNVVISANVPACQATGITGDLNGDGLLDGNDIWPFTVALISPSVPPEVLCVADQNGDGLLNVDDIPLFTAAVLGL
ncbi:MAG: VCBS repeat-containing protein [Phycisphaerae bacterium]|nr:VCBS repeat-containing protein [Phycisphaerae bacterium]